jgi:hypothetical protein
MAVPKTTLSLDRSVGPVNSTCLYISGFLFFYSSSILLVYLSFTTAKAVVIRIGYSMHILQVSMCKLNIYILSNQFFMC